jgi:hypothetical protein
MVDDTTISSERAISLQEEFFGNDVRELQVLRSLVTLLPGNDRFIDIKVLRAWLKRS